MIVLIALEILSILLAQVFVLLTVLVTVVIKEFNASNKAQKRAILTKRELFSKRREAVRRREREEEKKKRKKEKSIKNW